MLNSPSFEFGGRAGVFTAGTAGTAGGAGTTAGGLPELDVFFEMVFRMVVSCLRKKDTMPFRLQG